MKILLLQEERYFPTYGGGHKANRLLLEGLARAGHECLALCPAFNGKTPAAEFLREMSARGVAVRSPSPELVTFNYKGVEVRGVNLPSLEQRSALVASTVEELRPDLVLVSDDARRYLLKSALGAAPTRVVFIVHNHLYLPFGPLSNEPSREQTALMHWARAVLVVSRYSLEYVRQHAGLEAKQVSFPVYGEGPFPNLARFGEGCVTLVKPYHEKGVSVFLELARHFPARQFAAVATWGHDADEKVMRELAGRRNVRVLSPSDDIEEILAQTGVLLAPSLVPETFGLIVPEAMLRGIPVLASGLGGLREAKLGVDYLLPVAPARKSGAGFEIPAQDVVPWTEALKPLLTDSAAYRRCSSASREAALKFAGAASVPAFEKVLREIQSVD